MENDEKNKEIKYSENGSVKDNINFIFDKIIKNDDTFYTKCRYQKFSDGDNAYIRGIFCSRIENKESFEKQFGDLVENQIYESDNHGSLKTRNDFLDNNKEFDKHLPDNYGSSKRRNDYLCNKDNYGIYEIDNDGLFKTGNDFLYKKENKRFLSDENLKDILNATYGFFLILVISFVIYDIFTYVTNKNKENKIERVYCKLDYDMNNCLNVTATDGNYLNEFCKERLKCIEMIENNLYMTRIFSDIAVNLISSVYQKVGVLGTILILILSIPSILFFRILK